MSSNKPEVVTARRERILFLLGEGLSDRQVAERMGLHLSTVQYHRRKGGIALRPHRSLADQTVREIHRLHDEEEWPPGEIAVTLGLNAHTVWRHLGATKTGKQWNKVARWAAKNHRALWEELKQ